MLYMATFLVCYIMLMLLSLRPPVALDSYWHLQMGLDLINNNLSPWMDHYSFTYYGKEISPVPVFFQIILATIVTLFGENNGFIFLKMLYITAMFYLILKYFKQIKASWFIVFLVVPIISYFINFRLMIRPEILSNILIVICLVLYVRARDSFNKRELIPICLLLLFWVNYHTPVFGYIIIFGLFVDKGINKIRHKDDSFSWAFWILWGIIVFMIGFVNREGQHFFISMLSFISTDFSQYTQEYKPSYETYSTNKVVYLSWILSLYVAVWSGIKKHYGFAFIAAVLTYFSWTTTRLVSSVVIINFCILAFHLSQISYSQQMLSLKPIVKNSLIVAAVSMSLLSFYALISVTVYEISNLKYRPKVFKVRYPEEVADYLDDYQSGGNIFNKLGTGGFLISRLSPRYKIYIDGRTNILYPMEHVRHSILLWNDNDLMAQELKNKDIQFAVLKQSRSRAQALASMDEFSLIFTDGNYMLFADSNVNAFTVTSGLMVFPMCWRDSIAPKVIEEKLLSDQIFSNKSYTIKSFLGFLGGYIKEEDKNSYITALKYEDIEEDATKRLIAYLSMINQDYKIAKKYFTGIDVKDDFDILMLAYTMSKLGDTKDAEDMLFYFNYINTVRENGSTLTIDKAVIFEATLKNIEKYGKLTKFQVSYRLALKKFIEISGYNEPNDDSVLPYRDFCKSQFL